MKKPHRRNLKPRIVALGLLGRTAQAIAHQLDCSEVYAQRVLQDWRADQEVAVA